MSEFVLSQKTLDISLIRAIEDDDDDDNENLKEVLTRRDIDVNALGKNTWNNMPTTAIIMATNTKNYDKVTIFFNFGVAGSVAGVKTYYFDDVKFVSALSTAKFDASNIKMYPNPVKNTLNIEAKGSIERIAVYSILGQEVMSKSPKSNATTLQTSGLQKGTYIVKSTIDGKTATSKFIKE